MLLLQPWQRFFSFFFAKSFNDAKMNVHEATSSDTWSYKKIRRNFLLHLIRFVSLLLHLHTMFYAKLLIRYHSMVTKQRKQFRACNIKSLNFLKSKFNLMCLCIHKSINSSSSSFVHLNSINFYQHTNYIFTTISPQLYVIVLLCAACMTGMWE